MGVEGPVVIGITAYRKFATVDDEVDILADILPASYATAVSAVGGVPLLIPVIADAVSAAAAVSALHGLILSGGEDLNPETYGCPPHPQVTEWDDARDRSEFLLLDAADAAALPVLGICRGMQVMAVHRGGTLIPHLPEVVGHARHSRTAEGYADNEIATLPGSRFGSGLPSRIVGASWHHQAVAEHPGYAPVARDEDGVLQAMEAAGERFEAAVQWHPEQRADVGVFASILAAAREYRSRQALSGSRV